MLVAKRGNPEAAVLAKRIQDHSPDRTFLAEHHLGEALGWDRSEPEHELAARADLVIVLGGDGTFIHAARLVAGRPVPILGINLGSLGFMTEIPSRETFDALDEVLAGRLTTDSRMKLACKLVRADQAIFQDEVL